MKARSSPLTKLLGIVPALLTTAGAALAGNGYYVRWINVPDLDQRRAVCGVHPGLCGDGANFCGPTSCTDWFAFLNNHGYPIMAPGVVSWQNNYYDLVTSTIDHAASHCFAGLAVCSNGTAFGKIDDCLRDHLDEFGVEFMTVQADCEGDSYIGPNDMGLWMRSMGALVVAEVGWYEHIDNSWWKMRMGHFVPITSVWDNDAFIGDPDHKSQVGFRDADDSQDHCAQSPFKTATHDFKREFVGIAHIFQVGYDHRYQYKIDGYTSGNRQAYLNNYTALCTFFAVGFPWSTGTIKMSKPASHDLDPTLGDHEFEVEGFSAQDVAELTLHPLLPVTLVRTTAATSHPAGLYMFDNVRGWSELGALAGPGHMAFGRRGELYISEGNRLSVMQVDAIERRAGAIRSLDLPRPPDALAFDEARDALVVVDRAAGEVRTYPGLLNGKPTSSPLPLALSRPSSGPNAIKVAFDPATKALWAIASGSPVLYRLTQSPLSSGGTTMPEQIKLPRTVDPESINFTDKGHLVAWSNGDIVEFEPDRLGRFIQRPESVWAGRGYGPKFCVARSHSSATAALAATPVPTAPADPDARSVIECPADLTGPQMDGIPDGTVGDEDRILFMQLWQAGDPRADLDDGSGDGRHDFRVDDSDVAYFMAKYGDGCQ